MASKKVAATVHFSCRFKVVILFYISYAAVIPTVGCSMAQHVNFVLVGATGNLAQKYLWQGLYDAYADLASARGEERLLQLRLYGGARSDVGLGAALLDRVLRENVVGVAGYSKRFAESVKYVQLKTCLDYESFCQDYFMAEAADQAGYCQKDACNEDRSRTAGSSETGRIFYLSIPPYSYVDVAECIHRVCRPHPSSSAWLRVVFEKPFGSDLKSFQQFSSLLNLFTEEEVYLVDHYLSKTAVHQILPFRFKNRDWLEPLLTNEHVERIEIILKEKDDVAGRLNYYDSYGVFLDVLQNHAMEMLTLIGMNLPAVGSDGDFKAIQEQKIRFLKSIVAIHPRDVVAAQYEGYLDEGRLEFQKADFFSTTATFGAVLLRIPTVRWLGVPIVLASGKALDKKTSYIRVVFKNPVFSMRQDNSGTDSNGGGELVVLVSGDLGDVASSPSIAVSESLVNALKVKPKWLGIAQEASGKYVVDRYEAASDRAYSVVIADVIGGRRNNFVELTQLSVSWSIWTVVMERLKSGAVLPEPMKYKKWHIGTLENFHFTADGLQFDSSVTSSEQRFKAVPGSLGAEGHRVIIDATAKLLDRVYMDIRAAAFEAVQERGSFHIAFPGGRTPSRLFTLLSMDWASFPWSQTHVWFVDERCVPETDPLSNYRNAETMLLDFIRLPRKQVHPMPVQLARGLCHPDDRGADLYQTWMKEHLTNGTLDAAVLGVGTDCHVASLFPVGDGLEDEESHGFVKLVVAPEGLPVRNRMTLTYEALRAARHLFIIVAGEDKREVAQRLLVSSDERSESDVALPVQKVSAGSANARLYIDDFGHHEG